MLRTNPRAIAGALLALVLVASAFVLAGPSAAAQQNSAQIVLRQDTLDGRPALVVDVVSDVAVSAAELTLDFGAPGSLFVDAEGAVSCRFAAELTIAACNSPDAGRRLLIAAVGIDGTGFAPMVLTGLVAPLASLDQVVIESARVLDANGDDLTVTGRVDACSAPLTSTQCQLLDDLLPGGGNLNQCDRDRVRCDDTGQVVELDLGGVAPAAPAGLAAFQSLEVLRLDGNGLDVVPASIGTLANLRVLDLSGNDLLALPSTFAGLVSLEELLVTGNELTSIPAELATLPNLDVLLAGDNFIDVAPSDYTPGLQVLDLSGNLLSTLPELASPASNLAVLDLSGNGLSAIPASMLSGDSLFSINVSSNQLTSLEIAAAGASTIDARGNLLTELPTIAATGVRTVRLEGNMLSGDVSELWARTTANGGFVTVNDGFAGNDCLDAGDPSANLECDREVVYVFGVVVDDQGAPAEGVRVCAERPFLPAFCDFSDALGRIDLNQMSPANLRFIADDPRGRYASVQTSYQGAPAGTVIDDLQIVVASAAPSGGTIEGTVTIAGEPVDHGEICAIVPLIGSGVCTTASPEGRFRLPGLPVGNYALTATTHDGTIVSGGFIGINDTTTLVIDIAG